MGKMMRKISLWLLILLMFCGCVQTPVKDHDESQNEVSNDVQIEQDDVVEENKLILAHQYKLFVYNLQDAFYKNSTIWMILDADSNLNSYKVKKFHMDPIVEVQMLQEDEWVCVHRIEVPNLKDEDTEEASISFDIELSDFDYVDGTYRLKAIVYEKEKYAELISEEVKWISTELENRSLVSSNYLSLYPFNQYAENGMFTQNRKNVGKEALIRVLPKGCAVIAKEVGYQKIHHVPCEILNSDKCQFVHVKDVFDAQEQELFARRSINGYRDEEVAKLGSAVDYSDVMDFLESSNETILIPNCFDIGYEFGEEENFRFEYNENNKTIALAFINIEGQKGSFVEVRKTVDRNETILAVMWISHQMTKEEFISMLK